MIKIEEKQNLHTHTIYCDGENSPEEMVLSALSKDFTSIGFLTHAFMSYAPIFAQKGDHTEECKRAVMQLKEKYKKQIKIYLGLEVDMYSNPDLSGYDYLIGAVHYLKCEDEYVGFGRFDIIGHYDLITKQCEIKEFFDMESKEYINAALEAAEALSGKNPFFEINTGAMARGYRTAPSCDFMSKMEQASCQISIESAWLNLSKNL